jgi:hypothetical protein
LKCLELSIKILPVSAGVSNEEQNNPITANIIFNLAHLGLSIQDSKFIDIDTYCELIELEMQVINGKDKPRRATQADIDAFLL